MARLEQSTYPHGGVIEDPTTGGGGKKPEITDKPPGTAEVEDEVLRALREVEAK